MLNSYSVCLVCECNNDSQCDGDVVFVVYRTVIHDQKPFAMYALRISPHTFEAKCNAGRENSDL